MKCPNCGKEMSKGYLQTGERLAFNKHIHKFSLNPKQEEDVLIANNVFKSCNFYGFICKDCQIILFNYSDSNIKEK